MRIAAPRSRAYGVRSRALTGDSELRGIVLRMISANSLAAFAQDISRTMAATPVRSLSGVGPGAASAGGSGTAADASGTNRTLEAVPPAPSRPLPRGSLLDLRV